MWAIQQPNAGSAASLAWQLNDRNPLSPWCYIVFRKIILDFNSGLLFLRYTVGLALAIISYAFVLSIGGRRSRPFALGLGIVVAFFMANGYPEQVYWDREIALIFLLASVTLYARFVGDGHQNYPLYALSLVASFLAFAMYTIQCGAILAVAYLAFTRPAGQWRLSSAARAAFIDALPYGLLFVLYMIIWRTVLRTPETYGLQPDLAKLLLSLRYSLWHYDLRNWVLTLLHGEFEPAYLFAACIVGAIAFGMTRAGSGRDEICPPRALFDAVCVAALIALPTVVVEATGSIWIPGSRWRMIYQFTTPLGYLAVAAGVTSLISRPLKPWLWPASVGAMSGLAFLFSLGVNETGVKITRAERALRDAIASYSADNLRAGLKPPFQFIVLTETEFFWYSSDPLSDLYARTWFKRDDISFRSFAQRKRSTFPRRSCHPWPGRGRHRKASEHHDRLRAYLFSPGG